MSICVPYADASCLFSFQRLLDGLLLKKAFFLLSHIFILKLLNTEKKYIYSN